MRGRIIGKCIEALIHPSSNDNRNSGRNPVPQSSISPSLTSQKLDQQAQPLADFVCFEQFLPLERFPHKRGSDNIGEDFRRINLLQMVHEIRGERHSNSFDPYGKTLSPSRLRRPLPPDYQESILRSLFLQFETGSLASRQPVGHAPVPGAPDWKCHSRFQRMRVSIQRPRQGKDPQSRPLLRFPFSLRPRKTFDRRPTYARAYPDSAAQKCAKASMNAERALHSPVPSPERLSEFRSLRTVCLRGRLFLPRSGDQEIEQLVGRPCLPGRTC